MDEHDVQMLARHKATTGSELDGPDLNARFEFTCGRCAVLAAAIHDRTGWEIFAEFGDETDFDVEHVWVVNDYGRAVDINGVHSSNWAKTPFSDKEPKRIAPFPRNECTSDFPSDRDDFAWANEILDTHPELYSLTMLPTLNL